MAVRSFTDAMRPLTAHTQVMSSSRVRLIVARLVARRRRSRLAELSESDRARIGGIGWGMRATLDALTDGRKQP